MVNGFVNAVSGFADSPAVINGASDLLVAVFGDAGRHARAAVAVAGLPRNSTTEVQLVIEVANYTAARCAMDTAPPRANTSLHALHLRNPPRQHHRRHEGA
jgi:hypothetical protein